MKMNRSLFMGSAMRIRLHLLDLTKGICVPSTVVQSVRADVRMHKQQEIYLKMS